jgi:hypothetical protein
MLTNENLFFEKSSKNATYCIPLTMFWLCLTHPSFFGLTLSLSLFWIFYFRALVDELVLLCFLVPLLLSC